MKKENEPISESWEELKRRHELGELIRVEKVEMDWKALIHAIVDVLFGEEGRVNDEKTST